MYGEWLQIISVTAAGFILSVLAHLVFRNKMQTHKFADKIQKFPATPVFLFDGPHLVDATDSARDLLARGALDSSELDQLLQVLRPFFPTLLDKIDQLAEARPDELRSPIDDSLSIHLERTGTFLRLMLSGSDHLNALSEYKEMEQDALLTEADTLRFLNDNTSQLIWQEDEKGKVVWANKAYLRYSDLVSENTTDGGQVWPAYRMFDGVTFPIPQDAKPLTTRRSLQLHGEDAEHWFDVTSMPGPLGGLHYATDANETMRAQESQKAFLSTIANTFAQLSIGLAIFDRKRRLTSYNPSFAELTKLPAGFLISRPSIEVLLDRLRDLGRLPEPKNYASFREQFVALESKAHDGTYLENWNMPDGTTYRVTGRPHPNGALAFLFEDITAEISLTRRFRTEIEVSQAVLDNMNEAVAVFSATQNLIIANDAYKELWDIGSDEGLTRMNLRKSLRQWKSGCIPTGVWRGIESHIITRVERHPWSEPISLLNGRQYKCSVVSLAAGRTLIKFTKQDRLAPTLQKLTSTDPALAIRKA